MAEKTDLRILYDGIEGETSIDEKSGLNIKNDLIGVAKKINRKSNRPRIVVDLDEIATSTALSDSLKKIISSLKIEPVKIKFDVSKISNNTNSKFSKPVVNSQPIISQTGLNILDVDIRKFDEMTNKSVELSGALTTLHSCRSALESNGKITTDNQILSTYKEQYKLVVKLAALEKSYGAESTRSSKEQLKNINDIARAQGQFNKKISEFKKFGYNNTVFNKNNEFKAEYETLGSRYQSLIGSDDIVAMKQLNSDFDIFKRKVTEAGLLGQTFTDKLGAQMNKLGVYFAAAGLWMGAFNQFKNMIKDVIELDGAMTELKKVTDETDATYSKFLDNAESRAKRLGSTLTDTITATADFARLGFNLSDSEKIADAALVYKNVGDGIKDVSQASESIISTMKAFGFEASHTMEIVDRFNKVGKLICPYNVVICC